LIDDAWDQAAEAQTGHDLRLLPLLMNMDRLPALHLPLGMSERGRPLVIDLQEPKSWNLLAIGSQGAGKSELLRSSLLSLALCHRRSQVQLLAIDLSGRELGVLEALPHALTDLGSERDFVDELLFWLLAELERRVLNGIRQPALILALDELQNWIALDPEINLGLLDDLLDQGPEAGVHCLLAAEVVEQDWFESLCQRSDLALLDGRGSARVQAAPGTFWVAGSRGCKRIRSARLSPADLDQALDMAQEGWRVGLH
jgi:hypothetical protein